MKQPKDPNSREFLVERLEALDKDREHLHEDIRRAGHDPDELEAIASKRRAEREALEYDL